MNLDWCDKLDPNLIRIVKNEFKYSQMTIVQSVTIPILLDNKDVYVEACTGSGKSLSFLLPALQLLINKCKQNKCEFNKYTTSILIITPTRELTIQLYKIIQQFLSFEPLKSMFTSLLLVGGKNPVFDVQNFKRNGGNIIFSTPGRFLEIIDRCDSLVQQIKKCLELLILDEADMLLQLGFQDSLTKILDFLPKQRRTGLFSATMTKRIDMLIKVGLRNPVRVEIKEKNDSNLISSKMELKSKNNVNSNEYNKVNLDEVANQSIESTGLQISPYIENNYLIVPSFKYKLPFLVYFINQNFNDKILIFFATCSQINFYSSLIKNNLNKNVKLLCLHRKLAYRRQKVFNLFKNDPSGSVLFCTDVMSRGIDIPSVDWVINFDLPNDLQTFIHRCGRSGHCIGIQGKSLTICLKNEFQFIKLCHQKSIHISNYEIKYKFDFGDIEKLKSELMSLMKNRTRTEYKIFEMGLKAFVSYIRTYSSKNILSNQIFKDLDIMDLINSFCLINIPQMPELVGKLKGNMNRFEIEESDSIIAKNFKKLLATKSLSREGKNERKKKLQEKTVLRKKLKMMKYKKRKEYLNKIDLDELNADYSRVRKIKRKKLKETDLEF